MQEVNSIDKVEEILATYFKKNTWTNNFLLLQDYAAYIQQHKLFVHTDSENCFLYVAKNGFYRLYYFINNPELIYKDRLDTAVVMEILYRGEKHFPYEHLNFWIKSGFSKHLSRDCYFLRASQLDLSETKQSKILVATSTEEIAFAHKLIHSNLDLYTGDYLTVEELSEYAEKRLLFVSYTDNTLSGMLQADFKNNIFWLGHIVVDSLFRGKGLANHLVARYLSEGAKYECKQYQLWVIQDNLAAINLYKKYGFTYLNKSTISLLKK